MFSPIGIKIDFGDATPAELTEFARNLAPYIPPVERDPVARLILKEHDPVASILKFAVTPPTPSDTKTAAYIFSYTKADGAVTDTDLPLAADPVVTIELAEDEQIVHKLIPVNKLGIRGTPGPEVVFVASDPTPPTETGSATLTFVSPV